MKTGKLVSFSEKALVDCDTLNHGCRGGITKMAYIMIEYDGLPYEEDYPYEPSTGSC